MQCQVSAPQRMEARSVYQPCREPHRDAVSSTFHHDASPPHPPCHRSATPLMHAAHNGHMPTLEVRPAAAEDVLLEGRG